MVIGQDTIEPDCNAMDTATSQSENGIGDIGLRYWMAARYDGVDATSSGFCGRYSENKNHRYLCHMVDLLSKNGLITRFHPGAHVRAVIKLNSEVKIKGGKGTHDEPFNIVQ